MIVFVSGLPGAGKTTFAQALSKKLEATHLNSDIIRTEMNLREQYDPATKERVYQSMLERTSTTLREGKTVVVDATFNNQKKRKPFLDLAKEYRHPWSWIEIEADEQTIRHRMQQKRAYSEADFDVYLKIKAQYEPLDFPHLILRSDEHNLEEMVEEAERYLKE